jgi:predicted TIM-barrel fold metal-dependent hydrolase
MLQRRVGTTRAVIVTPRNYGTNNQATVDAIAQMVADARGIAVLHPTVSDAELGMLDKAGVRGIRFSLGDPASAVVTPAMIEPLARRVADIGWHVQFNMSGEQIMKLADVLSRLPLPMVFDHMANPPLPAGIEHPSHVFVRRLMEKGRTWVKLLRVREQPDWPSFLPRSNGHRARLYQGSAGASCVGQRLAASEPSR